LTVLEPYLLPTWKSISLIIWTYASNEVTSRSAEIVAYNNSDAALKTLMVKAVLMVCYPTKPLKQN
jgi:hypothetical protein